MLTYQTSPREIHAGDGEKNTTAKRGDFGFMVMTVRYVFSSPSTTVEWEKFIEF